MDLVVGHGLVLTTAEMVIWEPDPVVSTAPPDEILRRLDVLINLVDPLIPPDGLAEIIPHTAGIANAGSSGIVNMNGVSQSAMPRLSRLCGGLTRSASEAIDQAVAGLVGLGPGLTPSGDDLLGGMLVALRAMQNTASLFSVDALAGCPALGGSDAAKVAIEWCVGGLVHKESVWKASKSIQANPVILAVLIGDREAKVKQRTQRKIVHDLRKVLRDSKYRWTQSEGLWLNALRWAAVWEEFDGHGLKAIKSQDPLFAGLKRSKDISAVCSPFNAPFGVSFPRGRERRPEYVTLPRGHRVAPTQR